MADDDANANANANGIPRVGALEPRAVIEFLDQMGTLAGEPEDVCLAYLQEARGDLAQALLVAPSTRKQEAALRPHWTGTSS